MIDLFDRMESARANGKGVTLSHVELDLMYDLIGEALTGARDAVVEWETRLADYQRATARADRA